jgi:thiol-disulfide isomerase/thioredoxin
MIRNLAILGLLMALTLGYTWYDDYSRQGPAKAPQPQSDVLRQKAPDFSFETLEGQKHRLSDFRGKTVVLNFWASWCAPCVIEFPQMIALAGATKDKSVFLFISQDDSHEAVERFVKKYAKNLTENVYIGRDSDKSIAQQLYQTFKLPETYIITPDGMIADKIVGADVEWNGDDMRRTIESLR